MLIINNTDVIEGGASVDAVVEYTISGFVSGTIPINLATGVLSTTLTTVLVTASAVTCVVGITLTNTHSAAVAVTLRLDPTNSGAPRYIIPKTISLGIGYSLFTDGVKCTVMDASGNLQNTINLADVAHGGTGLATITDHGVMIGSGVDAVTPLTVGTTGQLLTGATGADPTWSIYGQIAFPATAVPSADPNTMDDYEEGTFTADFLCGTSGTITKSTGVNARYTKNSNTVVVAINLSVASVSSPVGRLTVIGMPFISNGLQGGTFGWVYNLTGTTGDAGVSMESGYTYFYVDKYIDGVRTTDYSACFQATSLLRINFTYFTV